MNNEREIEVEVENITYNSNSDYTNLTNKPSINGVELDGNKTSADLNITDTIYDDTQVRNDISTLQSSKVDKETGKTLSSNDYTNEEKSKLANLSNYDDTQIQSAIASLQTNKANVSDIPDVSNFITSSVDNLVNYYKKSETYTQSEVNNLIGAIQQFHYEIVSTLPQTGANNILYLVPKTTTETQNVYDEYVYANNGWEKIGDTQIDLSDYVTITMLNNALANYTTTTDLTTLLNAKQDNITSSNKLSSDLVDDTNSTNKFVTTNEKFIWNSKSDFSGSYNDLTDKPTIPTVPTNVSAFTNDAGYLTQHQDISGKQDVMQYSTMPTASSSTVGKIVQYIGTTDNTYTNGYFYIGTTDGESTPTYSWEPINVQDSASGGASKLEDLEDVFVFNGANMIITTNQYTIRTNDSYNKSIAQKLVDYMLANDYTTNFYCYFGNTNLKYNSDQVKKSFFLKPNLNPSRYSNYWDIRFTDNIDAFIDGTYYTTPSYKGIVFKIYFTNDTDYIVSYFELTASPTVTRFINDNTEQYISAKKTFTTLPESSVTPTTNNQLTNKSYVDSSILAKTYELSGLSAYSSSSTYSVDDYVYYNNLIYKCNTAVDTAEAFDSTKWTQKTYMEYISDALSV